MRYCAQAFNNLFLQSLKKRKDRGREGRKEGRMEGRGRGREGMRDRK
jgi:predicted transposase YdaD